MDKWDESVDRIKNGMLAEEPDAALAGALQLFADFGRTLEMISADMDRIATAFEDLVKPAEVEIQKPTEPQTLPAGAQVHDL